MSNINNMDIFVSLLELLTPNETRQFHYILDGADPVPQYEESIVALSELVSADSRFDDDKMYKSRHYKFIGALGNQWIEALFDNSAHEVCPEVVEQLREDRRLPEFSLDETESNRIAAAVDRALQVRAMGVFIKETINSMEDPTYQVKHCPLDADKLRAEVIWFVFNDKLPNEFSNIEGFVQYVKGGSQ